MTLKRFIVMFHDGNMNVADHEWEQVGRDSHAVVAEAMLPMYLTPVE
jgi:hypothetical protein